MLRPKEGKGGGKMTLYAHYERGQRGSAAAAEDHQPQYQQRKLFNPSDVPLLADDAADVAEPAQAHFEVTLLVRDVDKDTEARGMRRMTEADFEKMWCEIEGFHSARLIHDGDNTRYRGTYGLVTFNRPEDASDALSQTFGCGLNVSFYGTEECLEEVATEQQRVLSMRRR